MEDSTWYYQDHGTSIKKYVMQNSWIRSSGYRRAIMGASIIRVVTRDAKQSMLQPVGVTENGVAGLVEYYTIVPGGLDPSDWKRILLTCTTRIENSPYKNCV